MAARLRLTLALFVILACASAAHAQIGAYAMASGGFLGQLTSPSGLKESNSFAVFGGTFGIYDQFAKVGPLKFGADGRYFVESGNNGAAGNKLHGGFGGLRLAFQSGLVPVKPYIQAEVGGVSTNEGTAQTNTTAFAYQVQAGLDFTLLPHLDARAEYGGGQVEGVMNSTSQTLQKVGFGLVVRF